MSQRESKTAAAWAEALAQRLSTQRDRLRDAAAGQRETTLQVEQKLQAQLASIEQALQAAAQEGRQREADIVQKLDLLKTEEKRSAAQDADFARHRGELESVRQSLESAQQVQLARQQTLLDEVTRGIAQLQQRETALARQQAEIAATQAEVEARRRSCDDGQRLLAEREESLLAREAELGRRGETSRERDEALSQRENALHQREASLDQRDAALHQRDDTLRGREAAIGERSDTMREAERCITERESQLARQENEIKLSAQRARSQRSAIAQELRARRKKLLAELERLQLESARVVAADDSALVAQLKEARRELARAKDSEESKVEKELVLEEQLAQAKRDLLDMHKRVQEAASHPEAEAGPESGDLRKRLDMALADMRDLKNRNTDLSEQLAKKPSSSEVPASGGGDDWESRKQRMLAQLESDSNDADPHAKANKISVERTIQQTDEVISAKNQEISELQRLLSEQSGNIGGVAIGAAAIAEMLDTDELVRQERESLRELQEKLREQLKQAEVDLSMERAKVGRERAILDEKTRQFAQLQPPPGAGGDDSTNKTKQGSNRGRWLQRLGLRDDEKK